MKISYDYSEFLKEMQEELEDGSLTLDDEIFIVRKMRTVEHFGKVYTYNSIIDWYYLTDEIIEGDKVEKIKVKDFIAEMEEMNRII